MIGGVPNNIYLTTILQRITVLNRVKSNAASRKAAKEKGESVQLKRLPVGPRSSRVIEFTEVESLAPQPYDTHI